MERCVPLRTCEDVGGAEHTDGQGGAQLPRGQVACDGDDGKAGHVEGDDEGGPLGAAADKVDEPESGDDKGESC